jgi:hypothetical protein
MIGEFEKRWLKNAFLITYMCFLRIRRTIGYIEISGKLLKTKIILTGEQMPV